MTKAYQIISKVLKSGRKHLLEPEAKMVCVDYGIPTTKFMVAETVDKAVEFSEKIGFPVVMKIVSPDVIHKSEVGGVLLNIKSKKQVYDAFKKISENIRQSQPNAEVEGVLIQEMVPQSTEVIVGALKDPQFGPAIMFGLGGIFVEIMKDVTFRIAPITEDEACEMVREVKAYPILEGYRGQQPSDVNSIVKILLKTSQLMMDFSEIKEFDLNPIMVYAEGAKAVDARIILE